MSMVTKVLQTAAGRMIFAKPVERETDLWRMRMSLQVYNMLTRREGAFQTLAGGPGQYVRLRPDGVRSRAHLGHAKLYVSMDVIVRYLRFQGLPGALRSEHHRRRPPARHRRGPYPQGRARASRCEPMEVVERYMRSYFEDMDALGVTRP